MRGKSELLRIGKYYGYPECCLNYFVDNASPSYWWKMHAENLWSDGTGYIPCPDCAKKPMDAVLHEIRQSRECKKTFPDDGDYGEMLVATGVQVL